MKQKESFLIVKIMTRISLQIRAIDIRIYYSYSYSSLIENMATDLEGSYK